MKSTKRWYFVAGASVVAAVLLGASAAWMSQETQEVLDAAGDPRALAMSRSLEEQFELVGARYREFNDLVTKVQVNVFDGEWTDGDGVNVQMTMGGGAIPNALNGQANDNNAYYLARFWRLENVPDAEKRLESLISNRSKADRMLSKTESSLVPGEYEVAWREEEGTRFSLEMARGGLTLVAYSGVYWGDREALATAIWNIQQTELNEGTNWRPEKTNADGDGLIRPGEYPPFPEWRAVALEERMPKSRSQLE